MLAVADGGGSIHFVSPSGRMVGCKKPFKEKSVVRIVALRFAMNPDSAAEELFVLAEVQEQEGEGAAAFKLLKISGFNMAAASQSQQMVGRGSEGCSCVCAS